MTPGLATLTEASSDYAQQEIWLVGSLATGTQFQSVGALDLQPRQFHYAPSGLLAVNFVKSTCLDPFESISSQSLFAPDESAPIPSGEATELPEFSGRWVEPVVQRLDELLELPADWDHHGAGPIAIEDALRAFRFLRDVMQQKTPPPAVVPVNGGGIQLEWHRAGFDVEVLVRDQHVQDLYFCEIDSGREWEGPAEAGFAEHGLAQRLAD